MQSRGKYFIPAAPTTCPPALPGNRHGVEARVAFGCERANRLLIAFAVACDGRYISPLAVPQSLPDEETVSMPQVRVKENEPFDVALRRFKRACEKAGVLTEVRRREYHEKPTSIRKRKAAAAVKRHLKKLQREQIKRTRLY